MTPNPHFTQYLDDGVPQGGPTPGAGVSAICGSWRYARGEAAQCTRSPLHVGQCRGMATTRRMWRWERPTTTEEI